MRRQSAVVWLAVVAIIGSWASAATLQVGPTRTYTSVQAAVNAAVSGDTIEIDAATYVGSNAFATVNTADLTFRGVGGRPVMDFQITETSVHKYGWWFANSAHSVLIDNIEFKNIRAQNTNWGIAIGSYATSTSALSVPNTTVTNCLLHNVDCAVDVICGDGLVDRCETYDTVTSVAGENSDPNRASSGYFTLQYSYLHGASKWDVETRAPYTRILYNRFERGTTGDAAVYLDDLSSVTHVIGNTFTRGDVNLANTNGTKTKAIIDNHRGYLYVVSNTVVNYDNTSYSVNSENNTTYVYDCIFRTTPYSVPLYGNYIYGGHNWSTQTPGFADESGLDYHLTTASTGAINSGQDIGVQRGFSCTPVYEYVHPRSEQDRPVNGTLDIGAYEYATDVTVDAGADQYTHEGMTVNLHASAYDPDGQSFTYSWTQPVSLTGANTADASFAAPTVTTLAETQLAFTVTATCLGGQAQDAVNVRIYMQADVNHDDSVDVADLLYFADAFGSVVGDPNYDPECDFNGDGSVDVVDELILSDNFGRSLS